MMDTPVPSNSIRILNANKGISNIVPQKAINTDLRRVTDSIFDILSHHYGPYSGFAAKDDGQILKESTFTKDGIGIVRAINFVAPQEEWVRKTISYIGTRMESSVGDGTTSAMMFTCAMLKNMAKHIHELKPCNYGSMRKCWEAFIARVYKDIKDKYTYSVFDENGEPITEKVKNLVYSQVYTSSHGDVELSKALADMYGVIPKEQWERMTYERSRYETDTNYEVISTEGQYQMNAEVMASSMLNKDLCTWYEMSNVTLIIINDCLRVTHPDYQRILQIIDESSASRPVAILCHTIMDADSYQQVSEKIEQCNKEGKPLAIFTSKPEHNKVNDYIALQALVGVDITKYDNGDSVVQHGCRVKFKHKKLSIDNLYEEPEGWASTQRPHVTDGQHAQYTEDLDAWKNIATHYSRHGVTREDKEMANYFNRMYIKLRYTKVFSVVVGGKAYDNVAFVDVLDDAVRAASRALTNGGTLGNNRALYRCVEDIVTKYDCDNSYCDKITYWYAKRVKESLEDISRVVLARLYNGKFFFPWNKKAFVKWWFGHTVDLLHYDTSTAHGLYRFAPWMSQNEISEACTQDLDKISDVSELFENGRKVICQPSNSDKIMLERFGEVALKFILTEHVIIANGAYVTKKDR